MKFSKNTEVGCHALLQGIFSTQGLNPHLLCLLHWQVGSLPQGFPDTVGKESPAVLETPVRFLGWEDLLEKGWATHSSILGLPLWLSW